MTSKLHTVQEVAEQLGVTPGRIRQICRANSLGQMFGVHRVLTSKDVREIRKIPGLWKIQKKSSNRT